jgi:ubiquinone/menaquinone biosynthesis C-methylase UbiE
MALFDDYAGRYDAWFSTALGRTVWRYELKALLDLLKPRPGELILDAGCGTGILARELSGRGTAVVGVDLSAAMLAAARRNTEGTGVTLLQADINALPFSRSFFDAAVCFTALEFAGAPESVLGEIWRVLKPGGRLVIGVLNASSLWALIRRGRGVYAAARFYKLRELLRLAEGLGPLSVRWKGAVFFPPTSHQALLKAAWLFESVGSVIAGPLAAVLFLRIEKPAG